MSRQHQCTVRRGWWPWNDPAIVPDTLPLLGADGAGTRDLDATSVSLSERNAEASRRNSVTSTRNSVLLGEEVGGWIQDQVRWICGILNVTRLH